MGGATFKEEPKGLYSLYGSNLNPRHTITEPRSTEQKPACISETLETELLVFPDGRTSGQLRLGHS